MQATPVDYTSVFNAHAYRYWDVTVISTSLHGGQYSLFSAYRLVGLVVKASSTRAEDPGFESRLRLDFSQVESYR